MKFKDETGETQYGVSVTIREEISDTYLEELLDCRQTYRAAKTIVKFIEKLCDDMRCRKRSSLRRNSMMGAFERITAHSTSKDSKPRIRRKSILLKAKESYQTMITNEQFGEICVVEKCFVFIGTHEQSLLLNALKQITDLERMVSFQLQKISSLHYDEPTS